MRIALLHEWLPPRMPLKRIVLLHAAILLAVAVLSGVFIGSNLPGAAVPFVLFARYTLASLDDLPIPDKPPIENRTRRAADPVG